MVYDQACREGLAKNLLAGYHNHKNQLFQRTDPLVRVLKHSIKELAMFSELNYRPAFVFERMKKQTAQVIQQVVK